MNENHSFVLSGLELQLFEYLGLGLGLYRSLFGLGEHSSRRLVLLFNYFGFFVLLQGSGMSHLKSELA